jgi:prepilin-type N-terminal cleavage/methylation domain-containing protein
MYKTSHSWQAAYGILDGMKGGHKTRGFTIIETMMVLAISAGLFVLIAATLAGRQNRTEFDQSIQDVKAQIQQAISQVGAGVYANTNNFTCSAGAGAPVITAATGNQGANSGCIFLGKVVQFGVNSTTNPEETRSFVVAGLQKDASGNEVSTYAAAVPTAVAPSTSNPSMPDATTKSILMYGLRTNEIYYGSPKVDVGAIAFVNTLAAYSNGAIVSGSQQVNVIPINGSALNATPAATAQAINSNLASSPVNPSTGINLCFVSAGSNQSGLITIGGSSSDLTVKLSVKENKTCT